MILRDRNGLLRTLPLAMLLFLGAALFYRHLAVKGPLDPQVHEAFAAKVLDTGILIFREGLEAVLVLAALTAGLLRQNPQAARPILLGAGLAFLASIASYFFLVRVIGLAEATFSEYQVQAATGLLAVFVLLLVMNWFFHRIYWTGWIGLHQQKRQALLAQGLEGGAVATGFQRRLPGGFRGGPILAEHPS